VKIQEKRSKKEKLSKLSVIVTNVIDRLLINEQNFRIDFGKKKKKKKPRIKNLHFGSEQGILR